MDFSKQKKILSGLKKKKNQAIKQWSTSQNKPQKAYENLQKPI